MLTILNAMVLSFWICSCTIFLWHYMLACWDEKSQSNRSVKPDGKLQTLQSRFKNTKKH